MLNIIKIKLFLKKNKGVFIISISVYTVCSVVKIFFRCKNNTSVNSSC